MNRYNSLSTLYLQITAVLSNTLTLDNLHHHVNKELLQPMSRVYVEEPTRWLSAWKFKSIHILFADIGVD